VSEEDRLEALCEALGPQINPILVQALTAVEHLPTVSRRFHRLLDLVNEAMRIVQPYTPCREGCSHCCHMAVTVTATEAKRIALHIGKPYVTQSRNLEEMQRQLADCGDDEVDDAAKRWQAEQVEKWTRVPCVFLREGSCSIYPVRPLACRVYHTVAPSNEPCRLGQAGERLKEVPMIDLQPFYIAQVLVNPRAEAFGDIRDWFPEGRGA
jgi:Fe-S-cluster containining protein